MSAVGADILPKLSYPSTLYYSLYCLFFKYSSRIIRGINWSVSPLVEKQKEYSKSLIVVLAKLMMT